MPWSHSLKHANAIFMSNCIVITRPMPEAQDYAQELSAAGFSCCLAPALTLEAQNFTPPDLSQYNGILLTSAQAIRFFMAHTQAFSHDIPVYCVGKHTARIAQNSGFKKIFSIDGTGQDLANYINALPQVRGQKFLHIRGRDVAFAIDNALESAGIHVESCIVYAAEPTLDFPQNFLEQMDAKNIAAVTFFSKRTAENFMALIVQYGLQDGLQGIKALSISPAVLECLRPYPWKEVHTSSTPDRAGMMEILKTALLREKTE